MKSAIISTIFITLISMVTSSFWSKTGQYDNNYGYGGYPVGGYNYGYGYGYGRPDYGYSGYGSFGYGGSIYSRPHGYGYGYSYPTAGYPYTYGSFGYSPFRSQTYLNSPFNYGLYNYPSQYHNRPYYGNYGGYGYSSSASASASSSSKS